MPPIPLPWAKAPTVASSMKAAKRISFHVSKILIGETKNHFDSEYIVFNSLIYKPYDACHRMSSRYTGRDFPHDEKEDCGQRNKKANEDNAESN